MSLCLGGKSQTVIPYRLLDHTSDIKVEIYGADLAELFTNAATCLFDLILDRKKVRETQSVPVSLKSADLPELLLDWLRELLFLFSTHSLAIRRVEIHSIEPTGMPSAIASSSPPRVESVESAKSVDAISGSGAPSAVSGYHVKATVFGEEFSQERHGLKIEIKTPTYHQYQIDKTAEGYRATVIFDV